ncbi:Hypothetical predicted protein [Octopus vulgaris]|uniref:Uncharacterized protein n=1 Tax=Octopus vulgaris TaxID=6645 RepID=A0AA36BDQ9_OCTVU|nr:Hypothetical predicted protein [Octopus vulgaris]
MSQTIPKDRCLQPFSLIRAAGGLQVTASQTGKHEWNQLWELNHLSAEDWTIVVYRRIRWCAPGQGTVRLLDFSKDFLEVES